MTDVNSRLSFLRKAFGQNDRSYDGINYAFKCPNCCKQGSNKKKLVFKLDTGDYHCWVCDVKGRAPVNLIRKYKPALVNECLSVFGGKLRLSKNDDIDPEFSVELPNGFVPLTDVVSHRCIDPDALAVLKYAVSRDLEERDLWYYKLGTCLRGRYRRRLIMPSFDSEGELNYTVARTIDVTSAMKYLNSKIPKKKVIFNDLNIDWDNELTLVEGPFDLMKCNKNATCILGSSFQQDHAIFQKIVKNQTPVLLALDPDAAKKSHQFAKLLSEFGVTVRMMDVTGYDDVGSMTKKIFEERRKIAPAWKRADRLYHMISKIKSGTIF
tara:strand:+ start:35552 stop:36523 length:972 start_codon:yes stop_codon:yes gene_type:complete